MLNARCRRWGEGRRVGGGGGLCCASGGEGRFFSGCSTRVQLREHPVHRENAPLGMAVAFEAVRSGSRAIYLDRGLCGYVFARSCRAQNTILLASSQKAPILPSSLTKHVLALPIHPNRRPSPAPCVVCTSWATPMPVGGAVRPSYRTLRSVGGQQEVPQRAC